MMSRELEGPGESCYNGVLSWRAVGWWLSLAGLLAQDLRTKKSTVL
jgi:hypothetical protein